MTPSDIKTRLMIYQQYLDQDRSQLLEMAHRYGEIADNLPDAISGEPYVQLDNYLKHLRSTLNACEAVRKAIEKKLIEME